MADTDRSIKAYEMYRRASEKFDYFVATAGGALCAYMAQGLRIGPLGVNPATLELAALMLVLGSVISGVRRIELTVDAASGNHLSLHYMELGRNLAHGAKQWSSLMGEDGEVIDQQTATVRAKQHFERATAIDAKLDEVRNAAGRWYKARNWLLLGGFVALVGSRIWSAYA